MTSARRAAEEIARALAGAGSDAALRVGDMTPRELALAVEAAGARLKNLDLLAWLAGQYAAVGVGAPRRYPARPDRLKIRRVMTGDEMKACLLRLAARGEIHGS